MLLSLFRRHKLPEAKHLRDNLRLPRRIVDSLPIHDWSHYLRAHKSMADLLANYAMDIRTTTTIWESSSRFTPPGRHLLTNLQKFRSNDLQL
jgi:hypothetical protein